MNNALENVSLSVLEGQTANWTAEGSNNFNEQ